MTFQDIFQSSFLSRVSSVSPLDMGLALGLAFLLGLFIFLIYKKSYSGVMYSPSFGVTLIALALITTLLILAVSSNVVLSLGMVGALASVRFRTASKEPLRRRPNRRRRQGIGGQRGEEVEPEEQKRHPRADRAQL